MKRIAIFGGTFDPIHIGHMRGLIEANEIIQFEKIYLIPAGIPPHKTDLKRSPPENRLEMVKLAAMDLGFGEVNSYEIKSAEPSFTLKTLTHFKEKYEDRPLTLIIGSDSLLEINTWYKYEEVLSLANLAVLPRPGFLSDGNLNELEKTLKPVKIQELRRNSTPSLGDSIITDRNKEIILLKINRINVSSTDIRERVKNRKSIKFLVTESIEKYIIEKRLYREV